ncbi:hypothetical protein SELMODRAFT_429674 [Selaginella moellendorffii]|uniref:Fanconi-associated nuclease n=1 Tax=Selaginella moellendorffii TaxID=88036 RepID=D8T6X9_SELML|nr:hypothetical protein SELMODRAFT_429674 [Selaginella moellendorffii]
MALQYYAGEDGSGWKGVHSESGIWLTLFGLLMWDVIFSDNPDVFQTPFQTAPLDWCTDSFYPVQSSLIESLLQAIRDGGARQLVAETWAEHYGTSCSGVNWEKYSLEDLQPVTVCIGEDHSNWTAGMPDLLLWKEEEAKLAEVKGPGDHLSQQQVAWFLILSDANVPVELCKVSKTMNDRSQMATPSSAGTEMAIPSRCGLRRIHCALHTASSKSSVSPSQELFDQDHEVIESPLGLHRHLKDPLGRGSGNASSKEMNHEGFHAP